MEFLHLIFVFYIFTYVLLWKSVFLWWTLCVLQFLLCSQYCQDSSMNYVKNMLRTVLFIQLFSDWCFPLNDDYHMGSKTGWLRPCQKLPLSFNGIYPYIILFRVLQHHFSCQYKDINMYFKVSCQYTTACCTHIGESI